jgi:hypothetical protein
LRRRRRGPHQRQRRRLRPPRRGSRQDRIARLAEVPSRRMERPGSAARRRVGSGAHWRLLKALFRSDPPRPAGTPPEEGTSRKALPRNRSPPGRGPRSGGGFGSGTDFKQVRHSRPEPPRITPAQPAAPGDAARRGLPPRRSCSRLCSWRDPRSAPDCGRRMPGQALAPSQRSPWP